MYDSSQVQNALRVLERASLESQLPAWDDGRMIVEEGHIALKADEMLFATRRYRAPYGLEQVERNREGKKLDAAGPLYVALTEHKGTNPTTPSPLSMDIPGDKKSGTVEDRFKRIFERREAESGDESMDETLSEAGEDMVGKPTIGTPSSEEVDVIHEKMMELELLLEASGERNLRSIDLTHGDCPCHCLAQTVWYPELANLCLIWDIEEIKSLGLPEHRQKVTILVVSTMLALRWIEENIAKYRESRAPTAESIHAIDYSRRLELFETACKLFAIPVEVRHIWNRLRFFPWFRATLTSWLYVVTKDHMRKHQKEYRQFQAEIGPDAFKRPLLTHRNAITTGWKRVGRVSRDNSRARETILEEDLARNVSMSLHNSFCLNRESKVKSLPNQSKRLQEQREWMRSYEQLKAWEEIVISSDDEEALLEQITVPRTPVSGTSKAKNTR